MPKFFFCILFLWLSVNLVFAQKTFRGVSVTGTVKEAGGELSVEQSTIRLLQQKDSLLVKGTTTDQHGRFRLADVLPGHYLISASFVGFETWYKSLEIGLKSHSVDLGTIQLQPKDILLKEAVVTGKIPEMVVKEDTIEFHADAYKSQPNAKVEDLLKKIPGIEVDSDGKIKAKGKEIKKILIDGKEFFSDDPKVASKNLPSEIVEKLQIVDRKSDIARLTGVDDGEEEVVINLTIKEGMKKGWFGNVRAGAGSQKRYDGDFMANRFVGDNQYSVLGNVGNTNGADNIMGFSGGGSGGSNGVSSGGTVGTNLNIQNGKVLKIGGDLFFASTDVDKTQQTNRQNLLKDSVSYNNSTSSGWSRDQNLSLNLRMEWNIDSLSTLEFMPTIGITRNRSRQTEDSQTLDQDRDSVNMAHSITNGESQGLNIGGRLSYRLKSKRKKGRQISTTLTYKMSRTDATEYKDNNRYFFLNDSLDEVSQEVKNKTWGTTYRANVSYVEPIFKSSFLNFSYDYRFSTNNADKLAYDQLRDMAVDSAYSNRFRNNFQTQQIRLSVKTVKPKYTYNIGIHVDPSRTESDNLIDPERNVPSRMVVNVSPSLYYVYMFEKRKTLRIDYRGRTTQPSVSQLQPVRNLTNPLVIRLGNPDLNPSYNNNFSARYTSFIPDNQQSIMAEISGNYVLNSIVNQTTYRETGEQVIIPVNVNGVWNASGMFMYSAPFRNKKYQFYSNTDVQYQNAIGFTSSRSTMTAEKNQSGTLTARENLSLYYRSNLFDAGLRANYYYSLTSNSVQTRKDQQVMNFGGNFSTTVYLPLNIMLTSDLDYSGSSGYSDGFDRHQWLWNAQVSTQFLKSKQATVMVKVYDILRQRNNISRNVTGNYIEDIETNTLTSFFMIYLSYQFNTMGEGGSQMETRPSKKKDRHVSRAAAFRTY